MVLAHLAGQRGQRLEQRLADEQLVEAAGVVRRVGALDFCGDGFVVLAGGPLGDGELGEHCFAVEFGHEVSLLVRRIRNAACSSAVLASAAEQ